MEIPSLLFPSRVMEIPSLLQSSLGSLPRFSAATTASPLCRPIAPNNFREFLLLSSEEKLFTTYIPKNCPLNIKVDVPPPHQPSLSPPPLLPPPPSFPFKRSREKGVAFFSHIKDRGYNGAIKDLGAAQPHVAACVNPIGGEEASVLPKPSVVEQVCTGALGFGGLDVHGLVGIGFGVELGCDLVGVEENGPDVMDDGLKVVVAGLVFIRLSLVNTKLDLFLLGLGSIIAGLDYKSKECIHQLNINLNVPKKPPDPNRVDFSFCVSSSSLEFRSHASSGILYQLPKIFLPHEAQYQALRDLILCPPTEGLMLDRSTVALDVWGCLPFYGSGISINGWAWIYFVELGPKYAILIPPLNV